MKFLILFIVTLCVDFCSPRICCSAAGQCRICRFPTVNFKRSFPVLWNRRHNSKVSRSCGTVQECIRKDIIARNLIKHQMLRLHLQKLGLQREENLQTRRTLVKPKPVTQEPFVITKLAGATPHQMPQGK
ncbi:uncharacterized protein LOC133200950 [Saccostrea echinata]|uniref:uncharacterized protein LOC133200950 n=1 Tax=Saccostrea echinata TaxID=191078 RepID=UPI002A837E93|nr:uncharacterized protein LOC133200950 [Saccostrea echinata]